MDRNRHDSRDNAVRLQLHALAYNLGNFMRTLAFGWLQKEWCSLGGKTTVQISRIWMSSGECRMKVFGIGLTKTGTTSLTEALRILGYSAIHYDVGLRRIAEFDAATDTPVADAFEWVDSEYPGSKFILTSRPKPSWLDSCRRHWSNVGPYTGEKRALFQRLYGTAEFDASLFSEAYDRHEQRVLAYFSERPADLLVIDIGKDPDPWGKLCGFLNRPVPSCEFPHRNQYMPFYERAMKRLIARTPPRLRQMVPSHARHLLRRLLRVPAKM